MVQRLEDRLPPGVRAVRWRVGPRAAAGVLLASVLLAAALGVLAWRTWPGGSAPRSGTDAGLALPARSEAGARAGASLAPAPTPAPTDTPTGTPTGTVVVHVAGRVLAAGLVTLPAGSRVADALTAAGGPAPDADLAAVNLARPLVDGEQVLVPAPGQQPPPAPAGPAAAGTGTGTAAPAPLDLNTATAEQLDALPGVGEVLAARVVAWRQAHGRFTSVEELGEVQGIGPKLLDGVRDLVRV